MTTYFSWKLFKTRIKSGKPYFDFGFDTKEANQYIQKELNFIKKLKESGQQYRYLKIVPDDLPKMFWDIDTNYGSQKFAQEVENYFNNVDLKTEVIRISDLLKSPKINRLYLKVFNEIYEGFDEKFQSPLVDPEQFLIETKLRSIYYSKKPLSKKHSQELARKAFALFAAESAILYELDKQKIYPNLTLLAGERSKNMYKYDFFKFPERRSILPRLFVI